MQRSSIPCGRYFGEKVHLASRACVGVPQQDPWPRPQRITAHSAGGRQCVPQPGIPWPRGACPRQSACRRVASCLRILEEKGRSLKACKHHPICLTPSTCPAISPRQAATATSLATRGIFLVPCPPFIPLICTAVSRTHPRLAALPARPTRPQHPSVLGRSVGATRSRGHCPAPLPTSATGRWALHIPQPGICFPSLRPRGRRNIDWNSRRAPQDVHIRPNQSDRPHARPPPGLKFPGRWTQRGSGRRK